MGEGIRSLLARPTLRAVAGAILAGLVVLAMTLIWQGRRQPTVIVSVQHIEDAGTVRVYVGGAVVRQGIVTLPRGSRVADALTAAGGVTDAADTSALGMAAVLEDSDQIIVAAVADISRPAPSPTTLASTGTGTSATARAVVGDYATATANTNAAPLSGGSPLIDLNTATIAELDSLPGIGPAIAQRILDYRTAEGPLQSIEELEGIRGISARMVEELRPLVTIGP